MPYKLATKSTAQHGRRFGPPQSSRNTELPGRRRQAGGNLDCPAATRLGMERRRCSGALDTPAAIQI